MNSLSVRIFDTPEQAPNYNEQKPTPQSAKVDHFVIVGKGTEEGMATVDIVFEDHRGTKYVAMTTGALLRALVASIDGAESRP